MGGTMAEFKAPVKIVQTVRLELRLIQDSYLDDFHAIWSNPKVTVWSPRGPTNTLEESRFRMTGISPDPESPDTLNFGVFIRPIPQTPESTSESETTAIPQPSNSDRLIGVVGVYKVSDTGAGELGYIYNESFWGQGYASEALAAYTNTYWEHSKTINTMTAMVDSENAASIKVLKKCGFVEVGFIAKDIVLPGLPGWRDTFVFQTERPKAT